MSKFHVNSGYFFAFTLLLLLITLTSCTTEEQRNKDVLATASNVGLQADSKIICNEDTEFDVILCKDIDENIMITARNTGREVIYGFNINGFKKELLLRSGMENTFTIPSRNATTFEIVSIIKVKGEFFACTMDAQNMTVDDYC